MNVLDVVDVEMGGSITRLQAGHTYLLFVPDECSQEWAQDVRQRLDAALAAMGPARATVFVVSDALKLEDVTERLADARSIDHT